MAYKIAFFCFIIANTCNDKTKNSENTNKK